MSKGNLKSPRILYIVNFWDKDWHDPYKDSFSNPNRTLRAAREHKKYLESEGITEINILKYKVSKI